MIGIDICSVPRIRRICERHGTRFTDRIFTAREVEFARRRRDPYPHLAARWAAKEAVFKVLGHVDGFRFRDVEVVNDESGRPGVRLAGAARERARSLGIGRLHVSITHEREMAACVVMATPLEVAP